MTNYNHIKNMNIEQLAKFLYSAPDEICFNTCKANTGNQFNCPFRENVRNCVNCIKKYLESEVQGE